MKVRIPKDAGGPSLSSLNKLKKMQEEMEAKQAELAESEYSASSGGGVVTAVVTGTHRVQSVTIDPSVIDPDDAETLEDLIIAAVNEAIKTVDKVNSEAMSKVTQGINMPGLF